MENRQDCAGHHRCLGQQRVSCHIPHLCVLAFSTAADPDRRRNVLVLRGAHSCPRCRSGFCSHNRQEGKRLCLKTLSYVNRASRTFILTLLIAAFVVEVFYLYRGTKPVVDAFMESLGTPGRTVLQAILNYFPKWAIWL